MARKKPSNKRSVDFSNAGKAFKKETDYAFEVKAAEWKEGDKGDYISMELAGVDDEYANSTVYHNMSFSPKALSRTREVLEAMGYEVQDGEVDIDTDDLVGLKVMGTTYEDRYDGGKSIKIDEFYPYEDDDKGKKGAKKSTGKGGKKDEPEDIEYDDIDDDDIKALGKKMKIKAKKADDIREALADEDQDEVREAAEALDIDLESAGDKKEDDEDGDIDFDALSDAQVKKLGKEIGLKGRDADKLRSGLADADVDEVKAAAEELKIELTFEEPDDKGKSSGKASSKGGSKKSGKSQKWTEEEIQGMSEEELEEVLTMAKIKDVDLDEHKTLRKKKNAVQDALETAGLIQE